MNEALKAGKDLVMALRDLAREVLRARWISNVLQKVMQNNVTIADYNKSINDLNKEITRSNFRISKLDQDNPDYTELLADFNSRVESYNKGIEREKANIIEMEAMNTEEMAKIAKIESGELKVSAESLESKSKELIEAYYTQKVTEVIAE